MSVSDADRQKSAFRTNARQFHLPGVVWALRCTCSLHTLDKDHVRPRRAVPHLARLAILFTIEPLFGALR